MQELNRRNSEYTVEPAVPVIDYQIPYNGYDNEYCDEDGWYQDELGNAQQYANVCEE